MSILKSTNRGKRLLWHNKLDQLSEDIYNTVKDFPSKLWELHMYYDVPYTQNGETGSYHNKMIFDKNAENKDDIKHLILTTFHNEIAINAFEIGDDHHIEDIDISNPEIKIERFG